MYRLSVLTGRQPVALNERLKPQPLPNLPPLNSIGTPEVLLRRRPDIRVAERRLAGATARVGVAVGDLFPKVTLSGDFRLFRRDFRRFRPGRSAVFLGWAWRSTWAAFDLGRVRARISSARAETDAALASYEGAVLNALEDTEGALIGYGRAQLHRDSLAAAAVSSDRAADLARKRFEGGLVDFLEVLDAERTALSAELVFSQSRTDAATSLIAVYKALGAGWDLREAGPMLAGGRLPTLRH